MSQLFLLILISEGLKKGMNSMTILFTFASADQEQMMKISFRLLNN